VEGCQRDLHNAHVAAVAELIEAAKSAVESDGGTRYEDADDEVGTRACCYEVSYAPHEPDCWVNKLRAALAKIQPTKE
jgi:hypothetical protein